MKKLYSIKDEKSELYFQIEIFKELFEFLDKIALMLFDENWMIDNHYHGKLNSHDYFSFEKEGVYLLILIAEKRVNVVIIGLPENKEIKNFLFEIFSF